jgi:hypothetical protein
MLPAAAGLQIDRSRQVTGHVHRILRFEGEAN